LRDMLADRVQMDFAYQGTTPQLRLTYAAKVDAGGRMLSGESPDDIAKVLTEVIDLAGRVARLSHDEARLGVVRAATAFMASLRDEVIRTFAPMNSVGFETYWAARPSWVHRRLRRVRQELGALSPPNYDPVRARNVSVSLSAVEKAYMLRDVLPKARVPKVPRGKPGIVRRRATG
jgi:hypothetical protein